MDAYSIWLVEYAYCATQPVSSLMYSKHNQGVRTIPFTFLILKGNDRTVAIDTGYIDEGHGHELSVRFGMTAIRPVEKALADIGVRGEEVDTVILTHAHYDHLGGSTIFPNAHFYLQKKELLDWIEALARPKEYAFLTAALDPNDIRNAIDLADAGRLTLLDGATENILPGISCFPVFNSHTYGHQVVTIGKTGSGTGADDRWVFTGDACYSFENYGADGKGPYLPVGFGVGSITGMVDALVKIRELAGGDLKRLIITHDSEMWGLHPSAVKSDGMRVAEVQLAQGEKSRITI